MSKYVERVQRLANLLKRHGFDLVLVVLVFQAAFEATSGRSGGDSLPGPAWIQAATLIVFLLPLFARRRYPFAAPTLVWVLGAALSFVDGLLVTTSFTAYVAGIAAAYLLGNLSDSRWARIGLGVVIAGAAVVVANDPRHTTAEFITIPATFTVAWLAGFALRVRAEQASQAEARALAAERERESAARVAVAEERARINRELHDIVAHAMSVMVLQVGAVRHRLPDSLSEDKDALMTVEETGRGALTEMRRLLGVIQEDGANLSPQPGLARLGDLVEEVGLAGLSARLHIIGEPAHLPQALDLSAYRIIQEGLTNSLRHSGARCADVTVRYSSRELQLEVRDDGLGSTTSDGLGRGLVGIRERVKIYGGDMSAGTGPNGGYLLMVRLPIVGQAS
jgi:signal transduction histidine kinase